ncbi:MAG: hypothetical protein K2H02_00340, partial [Anaeroplasmataceae bacterium]|nr:hypothetical protein [Anaeroplasmataceae bacterium]
NYERKRRSPKHEFLGKSYEDNELKKACEENLENLPSNIEEASLLYGNFNTADFNVINNTELSHFIDALFATTNEEVINFDELTIDRINLPHSKEEALKLTYSGIFTATMSKEVLSIGQDNIVVLDDSKAQDNGYTYIMADDLADLVVGLSVGLGMSNLNEVSSFDTIAVPETENTNKVNAITDSIILRATISKKALANNTVRIFINSSSYAVYQYQNKNVLVFEKEELSHLIDGINMMGGDFDNLSISLEIILAATNKGEILNVIAHSDIYRGMLSEELMKEVFNLNAYKIIYSSTPTHDIELDGVVFSYEYQSYLGRYIIQDPEEVGYYTDFEMMNMENHYLFTKQDILALEYVSISNL